jgi:hypothetical protein
MKRYLIPLLLLLLPTVASQAQSFLVNLASLDGIELKRGNILNYQVINNTGKPERLLVHGSVVFRREGLRFTYDGTINTEPGVNTVASLLSSPAWQFSSPGLKDLFMQYDKLPQGTYEYCVQVKPVVQGGEAAAGAVADECLYYTVNDVFLISLVEPEDGAKIYETHPALSWMVNYPFASELTYRIRVAEQKKGQNKANAVMRNPSMYEQKGIIGTSIVYPATARELEKFKPYAWTVDAYYRDVLIGGAEPWMFMIVEDSLKPAVLNPPYVDIRRESDGQLVMAPGVLKIKYYLSELKSDVLNLSLVTDKGKAINTTAIKPLNAVYGDNRYEIDLGSIPQLRHMKQYTLQLAGSEGKSYKVTFRYINPELVKQ